MATRPTTTQTRNANAGTAQPAPAGNLPAEQPQRQRTATEQAHADRMVALRKFGDFLIDRQGSLLESLPPTISPVKFISVVKTALANKPSLLECTFASLWNACLRAAQDGLLPDGREGAIAPFGDMGDGPRKDIATWLPMIAGYRKKARNAGIIDWRVELVYENDEFDFELGDTPFIKHRKYFGGGEPGPLVGAYSIVTLPDKTLTREVMTIRELDQIRSKSKAAKGPWSVPEFTGEMYKKTIARRHYKQLASSDTDYELAKIIEHDDNEFGPDFGVERALPAPAPQRRAASPVQRLEQFAGDAGGAGAMIDHDTETGEVIEDDFGDAGGQKVEDKAPVETKPAKPASAPARDPISTGTRPTADKAAVAAGTAESASGGTAAAETAPERAPPEDKQLPAGDPPHDDDFPGDKPSRAAGNAALEAKWDAGQDPETMDEYRHYLPYVLRMNVKVAGQVGPYWSSPEQKELRQKIGADVDPFFTELKAVAMAYRAELANKPI